MLAITKSMSLQGLTGYLVEVQVDVSAGIPSFELVGLPDVTIRESKERVKTAIKNSGFNLFSRKIVVNLAPATRKKEGSIFDLPVAIGILKANEYINQDISKNMVLVGELSLDGKVNKVNGILPICVEMKKLGITEIILPRENAKEASIVGGIKIIPVSSLKETVNFLNGEIDIEFSSETSESSLLTTEYTNSLDFADVKGQKNIKRAIEVAASRRA